MRMDRLTLTVKSYGVQVDSVWHGYEQTIMVSDWNGVLDIVQIELYGPNVTVRRAPIAYVDDGDTWRAVACNSTDDYAASDRHEYRPWHRGTSERISGIVMHPAVLFRDLVDVRAYQLKHGGTHTRQETPGLGVTYLWTRGN